MALVLRAIGRSGKNVIKVQTKKSDVRSIFIVSWKLNQAGKLITKSSGPHFRVWITRSTNHSARST